jgi:hypothetical protein
MNLTLAVAPEHAAAALAEQLAPIVSGSRLAARRLGGKSLSALGPIPLYHGELDATGTRIRSRMLGWRYLVMHQEAPVAVVDLERGRGGKLTLSHIHYEVGAAHLHQALSALEKYADSPRQIRLIVFPRLHLHAIWLYSRRPIYLITHASASGPDGPDGLNRPLTRKEMTDFIIGQHQARMRRARPDP